MNLRVGAGKLPAKTSGVYVTETAVAGYDQRSSPWFGPTHTIRDTQGLSDVSVADFESVKGLVEEGQYLEAAAVEGVENAPNSRCRANQNERGT